MQFGLLNVLLNLFRCRPIVPSLRRHDSQALQTLALFSIANPNCPSCTRGLSSAACRVLFRRTRLRRFTRRRPMRAKQALEPRLKCALASQSQRRIESEPRDPSQLRGVRGVARTARRPNIRIATIRNNGLKVFLLLLPCFGWSFWLAISEPGWTSRRKKIHMESGLNKRDRAIQKNPHKRLPSHLAGMAFKHPHHSNGNSHMALGDRRSERSTAGSALGCARGRHSRLGLAVRCGDLALSSLTNMPFCTFFTCSQNTQMAPFSLIPKVFGHV